MQPEAVVKANNVVSNIVACFCMIGIVFLPNPLHFQIQEEAFHDGVIPAVALAAHAAHQAMFGKQRLMLSAGVLGGFNGLLQHLNYGGVVWEDQRGGWKRKQVARRCVRQGALRSISGCQIQPAAPRADIGDIAYPDLVGQRLRKLPIEHIALDSHGVFAIGGVDKLAPPNRAQAIEAHQSAHAMPAHG